jgi:hypothetical protein
MRTEALYLDDIIDAADAIARFLHGEISVAEWDRRVGPMPHDIIDNRRASAGVIFDDLGLNSGEREAVAELGRKRLERVRSV